MSLFFAQNTDSKRSTNGRIYNYYAIITANMFPTDWDVPTEIQLQTLRTYVGGFSVGGGHMKDIPLIYWNSPNTDANDTYGFKALGSGERASVGNFNNIFTLGTFHCKDINEERDNPYFFYFNYNNADFVINSNFGTTGRKNGRSIRLIWNGVGVPSLKVKDFEGIEYDVIQIGTQYWLKQNWASKYTINGSLLTRETSATNWAALTTEAYCEYNNVVANVFI